MWRPLLRFAVLGTALFAADRLWWSAAPPPPVVIEAARVEALGTELARMLGRAPTREELARALEPEVDDELLYREALARGWLEDDPVVFRRLVQNLRFAGADPARDDASLFEEALALGLHESDVVVRRRLAQRMRLAFEATADHDPPDEAALRAYHARHAERYRRPARVRLIQIFYAREHAARARADLARLRASERAAADVAAVDAGALGDPFLLESEQPPQTRDELGARFGAPFGDAAFDAPEGEWTGPVPSAYGLHLVRVHERVPARALPFEEVRAEVELAAFSDRRTAALERALEALREDVVVRVEWTGAEEGPAPDADVAGASG